jgi:XTP/dITP diphosphohydrolase
VKKLIIASSNPGKLREFRQMLEPLGYEIIPQSQLGIPDAEEPHATFVENALAKARHASRLSGLPAFSDDSGICVDALGGTPGVKSARFAADEERDPGEMLDVRNNRKLIRELSGSADRRAHYYCVIVLVRNEDDPEPLIVEGRWRGEVIDEPRGQHGFGYDPHFYLPELGWTAAELDAETKNRLSHRGQALRQLVACLQANARGD